MVIYAKNCKDKCPESFYSDSKNFCQACTDPNCSVCPVDGSKCDVCKSGWVKDEFVCKKQCPLGKFENMNRECQSCGSNCDRCLDEKTCIDCKSGFSNDLGLCKDKCPSGKVSIANKCENCKVEKCDICDNKDPAICLDCVNPLVLHNNTCITSCPDYFYPIARKCKNCGAKCKKCNDNTDCTICEDNFFIEDKVCVNPCKSGFVGKDGRCTKCGDDRCHICDTKKFRRLLEMQRRVLQRWQQMCDFLRGRKIPR